jgi:hypothetical protein
MLEAGSRQGGFGADGSDCTALVPWDFGPERKTPPGQLFHLVKYTFRLLKTS